MTVFTGSHISDTQINKSHESTRENVTGVNQFVLLPNLRPVYILDYSLLRTSMVDQKKEVTFIVKTFWELRNEASNTKPA